MKEKLTAHAHRLEGQPMFRLLERIKQLERQGRDIVHFEIGDPNFPTPAKVVSACMESLQKGNTHYTSSFGLENLRSAIADYTHKTLGFKPALNQVLISPGSNALIYFVIQCLVKPDEEVIVPDPAFPTYYSVLKFLNLKAVPIPLREENFFRMNPEDIRRAITPKTKLIIINSPQNPTGSVMTQKEIEKIVDIAQQHDLFILSDEIYRLMAYETIPCSPSIRDHCEKRTIIMTGFSKSFAMTGWRLGYMIAPEILVEKIALLVQTIVSCVSPFIQEAGITVLEEDLPELADMMSKLKVRRDLMVNGLNQLPGVSCLKPEGAFYVFPNVKNTGMTSEEFANVMLEEAGVALLPGTDFGESCEGYVRLCFANPVDRIQEGLLRMRDILLKRQASAVRII